MVLIIIGILCCVIGGLLMYLAFQEYEYENILVFISLIFIIGGIICAGVGISSIIHI